MDLMRKFCALGSINDFILKNGSDENIIKKIIYIKRNIIKMSEHDYFAILILV